MSSKDLDGLMRQADMARKEAREDGMDWTNNERTPTGATMTTDTRPDLYWTILLSTPTLVAVTVTAKNEAGATRQALAAVAGAKLAGVFRGISLGSGLATHIELRPEPCWEHSCVCGHPHCTHPDPPPSGTTHGAEAHNEAMGWDTSSPECGTCLDTGWPWIPGEENGCPTEADIQASIQWAHDHDRDPDEVLAEDRRELGCHCQR